MIMKKTRYMLTAAFAAAVAAFLAVVLLFETGALSGGGLAAEAGAEYAARMVMELSVLVCIPLALRLFRFGRVQGALSAGGSRALASWGLLRIVLLGLPLVLNILFYYLFGQSTYGYISLIFLVSMVFVYPDRKRCENETQNREER